MRYKTDEKSKTPEYMQLYSQIRSDIVNGSYSYGARLPSKRLLADEVGVSVITVQHAYEILCDEGYAEARSRSGYYACYRDDDFFPDHFVERPASDSGKAGSGRSSTLNTVAVGTAGAGNGGSDPGEGERTNHDDEAAMDEGLPMDEALRSGGESGEEMPYTVLAKTMRRVLTNYGERILSSTPGGGLFELRAALSSYLARSRGMRVAPSQIIIGAGAEYLYSLIVQILGHERVFALEDPSYEKIRKMYETNGVCCEMLKMGRDGILSSELLSSKASVLHVTPFNSFPSGVTASASKRREYINWAIQRDGFIIEDDFDSEYTVSSKSEDTLFSLEPSHTVFYLNTFSKTIAPSLRAGYMILPEDMVKLYREKAGFYACTVPTFEQYVIAELINNGDFERHINRVRRKRRKAATDR